MIQLGSDTFHALARGDLPHAKLVFNDRGFIAFPTTIQHNTMKAEGISYEDNYAGNALAAMLKPGVIEVRFHRDFSDRAVGVLLSKLVTTTVLSEFGPLSATYQGRPILIETGESSD
ncbi:MAG: hypothetical protein ACFCBV_13550 [Phycisphaerales bacterium]